MLGRVRNFGGLNGFGVTSGSPLQGLLASVSLATAESSFGHGSCSAGSSVVSRSQIAVVGGTLSGLLIALARVILDP